MMLHHSESLTELENMTVDLFGQVENKDVKVQHWSGNPIGPKQTKVRKCTNGSFLQHTGNWK